MNRFLPLIIASLLCPILATAQFQIGKPNDEGKKIPGPNFTGRISRLFGENKNFAASVEINIKPIVGDFSSSLPGTISFDHGRSRFEVDLTKATNSGTPASVAAQMKSMGMDISIFILRPDKKVAYTVYPGRKAYVETPMDGVDGAANPDQFKIEVTELSRENVNGYACIKNKVMVTNDKGDTRGYGVWNAVDLKGFPVKIEDADLSSVVTMSFQDVKLGETPVDQFDAPAGYTKYDGMAELLKQLREETGKSATNSAGK
jgi:Domain of unknown function (DUF4412)